MWPDINLVSEAIAHARIAENLNISKIALLSKSEDRLKIQNFCPIS
jgi:hypothetical protein